MSAVETAMRYCPMCGSEMETPVDVLAGLAAAPSLVGEALSSATGGGEGWSPAEVAAHLADTEIVTSWRFRQTLAEDEPDLAPYDQDRWAAVSRYSERDSEASLALFAALRTANVDLLRSLADAGWERAYRHVEYGRLTIRQLAQHKSDHDLAHIRQMRGE
jgi:hypothetical protein